MLRVEVRNFLYADDTLRGVLAGGIYPLADSDPDYMGEKAYPAAFNEHGEILPVALVRDGGSFPHGPSGARGAMAIVDILLWQQAGRDAIDAALKQMRVLLDNARVSTQGLWVYRIAYAGDGPSVQDPAIADAEHGWQRWQVAVATKG